MGPLPVISRVITSLIRVITPFTHLFSAIYRGYFTPFITIIGAHLLDIQSYLPEVWCLIGRFFWGVFGHDIFSVTRCSPGCRGGIVAMFHDKLKLEGHGRLEGATVLTLLLPHDVAGCHLSNLQKIGGYSEALVALGQPA